MCVIPLSYGITQWGSDTLKYQKMNHFAKPRCKCYFPSRLESFGLKYKNMHVYTLCATGVVLPGAMARLMTNKVLATWHDRVFIFGFHHSNSLMIDDGRWVWWTIWRQGTVPDITRLFIVVQWLIEDYSIVDYSWRVVDKVCR